MPQDHINFDGTRSGMPHSFYKENSQISRTGLVNGPVAPNDCKAASITTSERTPDVTLNTSKLLCMDSGYVNSGYKGKSVKAAPKEGRRTDAAKAGKVSDGGPPGGISVNGVLGPGADAFAHNSDHGTPEQSNPGAVTNKGRRKKLGHKRRDTKGACLSRYKYEFLQPREEENWENDIQDLTLTERVKPYGPEDMLKFDLQGLTLKPRDTGGLQVTANYCPAVHHTCPVPWFCPRVCTEPGQFADVEE